MKDRETYILDAECRAECGMSARFHFVTYQYDIPITNMFDVNAEETDDPQLAVVIIGKLPNGKWLTSVCWDGDIKDALQ